MKVQSTQERVDESETVSIFEDQVISTRCVKL